MHTTQCATSHIAELRNTEMLSNTFEVCCIGQHAGAHVHQDVSPVSCLADDAGTGDDAILPVSSDVELTAGVHVLWVRQHAIIGGHRRQPCGDRLCRTAQRPIREPRLQSTRNVLSPDLVLESCHSSTDGGESIAAFSCICTRRICLLPGPRASGAPSAPESCPIDGLPHCRLLINHRSVAWNSQLDWTSWMMPCRGCLA